MLDDEKMQETVESIRNYGVLMPGIARPRAEGGYEITPDTAENMAVSLQVFPPCLCLSEITMMMKLTVIMVDTNIQRKIFSQVKRQKPIP